MLSGETSSPPDVIGPPQPTPHATADAPSTAALSAPSSSPRDAAEQRVGICTCRVGCSSRHSTSPSTLTSPAASFVPPMSSATTTSVLSDPTRAERSAATAVPSAAGLRWPFRPPSRRAPWPHRDGSSPRAASRQTRWHVLGRVRADRRNVERVIQGKPEVIELALAVPGRRGPPPDRGRARRRQDEPGEGAGRVDRLHVRADAVHARPAALRRRRRQRLEPRRRASSSSGPGPSSPTSCSATRSTGPRRRRSPRCSRRWRSARSPSTAPPTRSAAVHGHRDAEPDRARGHVPAAREPARPLPHAGVRRLSRPRRPSSRSSTPHGDARRARRHPAGGRPRPTSRR